MYQSQSTSLGETGRTLLEMIWARPTAEVNGIWGGYTGEGFKTVIPAEASAKVSFRLVHDQDPAAIRTAFRDFVRARIPADCSVEFEEHGGAPAIQLPYDSPLLQTARGALSDEWETDALMIAMGGSIPIVGDFQRMLGMESLLVGFGLLTSTMAPSLTSLAMYTLCGGLYEAAHYLAHTRVPLPPALRTAKST